MREFRLDVELTNILTGDELIITLPCNNLEDTISSLGELEEVSTTILTTDFICAGYDFDFDDSEHTDLEMLNDLLLTFHKLELWEQMIISDLFDMEPVHNTTSLRNIINTYGNYIAVDESIATKEKLAGLVCLALFKPDLATELEAEQDLSLSYNALYNMGVSSGVIRYHCQSKRYYVMDYDCVDNLGAFHLDITLPVLS